MKELIKKMYNKFKRKVQTFLDKMKESPQMNRIIANISHAIEENHEKSSWVNIATLITNILGFAVYCAISPVLAEYRREKGIRTFSVIAIIIIVIIIIWEFICLVGCDRLKRLGKLLKKLKQPVINIANKNTRKVGLILCLSAVFASYLYFHPNVTYCTSIVEIYGIPTKSGEELETSQERKKCSVYWEIKDYPHCNYMVLTYVEPYKQLELMKQNSTAYSMKFFQPAARIKIHYKRDKNKYLSLNQNSFEVAKKNNFREPTKISYYSSNNKLILKMVKNKYGKYEMMRYSSTDMPQLLNSTLLYTQDQQVVENSMTSQQIEVTYNADGLPLTRKLSPSIYNLNGINGEQYVYDEKQRLKTLYYLDINGEFVRNKQGIMMVDFEYEDNGSLHSIRYYSGEDRKQKTEGYQGVFCELFSYDSHGNLKERSQRDRNENLHCDKNGICTYRYKYDDNSALIEESFFGFDGEEVQDNYFHSTYVRFKKMRNLKEHGIDVLLDEEGIAIEIADTSITKLPQYMLDSDDSLKQNHLQGQTTSLKLEQEQTFQTEQEQTSQTGQKQVIQLEQENEQKRLRGTSALQYNPQDNYREGSDPQYSAETSLDESADIIRKYVLIRYTMNRAGCVRKVSYYNRDIKPVECKEGYAIKQYAYDREKRVTSEKFYDVGGKLCRMNGGFSIIRKSYESEHNDDIKMVEYLDAHNKPVLNKESGYARVRYTRSHDEKNLIVHKRYFDENDNPVRLPGLGYEGVDEYYNERNFLTQEIYCVKNDNGEYIETCRKDYGVAEIMYEYEDRGNRICELYKDENAHLVNRQDTGYAAVYWEFEGGQIMGCHYERQQNQMLKAAVDITTGISRIRYTYESGKKVKEEYYDTDGQPSFRTDIGCAAKGFEYNDRGEISVESYYGLAGESILRKDAGYARATYQYDGNGRILYVRFYDLNKQPVISAIDHCAGYDYNYDKAENETSIKYIGLNGEPMIRRDLGYAQVQYQYDEHGNVKAGFYRDINGELTICRGGGYAYFTNDYDTEGNWKETRYYAGEDIPVLRQDIGCFKIRDEYSDGELKRQEFFGTDEMPIISTKYGCAAIAYEYDYDNKSIEGQSELLLKKTTTYIGLDGNPMVRRDLGYAQEETFYDSEDNNVSSVYYDATGAITVRNTGGYASFESQYINGKEIKCDYFNQEGIPVLRNDTGYAVIEKEYDDYGRLSSERYYDENHNLIISTKYHCAGYVYEYDEKGNKTHVEYLGKDGKIMVRRDLGYAQMTLRYDDIGNKISEAYFDVKGRPVVCTDGGYAFYISEYESGNWLGTRYFDKKGGLTLETNRGYAVVKNEYDEYGQRIRQTYYDASDKIRPIISKKHHCAGYQFEYDERGNRTYTGYLDFNGNLMTRRDLGYAQLSSVYDDIGNQIRKDYFDIAGNPAVDKEGGYHYYTNHYDDRGRLEEVKYFLKSTNYEKIDMSYNHTERFPESRKSKIENGEPALRKDEGYASVKYEYDEYGQERYVLYSGVDGRAVITTKYSCAGFKYNYNERGNKTDIYYLGLNTERIVRKDLRVAHIAMDYDLFGNLIKESYFDTDNEPTTYMNYGYAYYVELFENGHVIETQYRDAQDDLVLHGDTGYAIVQYEYDDFGQCIFESYYDADIQPVLSTKYCCAGFQYEYDERGNQTDCRYLGTDGYPMICSSVGYAYYHLEYDDYGNKVRSSYYDVNGNPAIWNEGGSAVIEYKYENGNCVEWRYYDSQGELTLRSDTGYAIERNEYDVYGQLIGEYYYDNEEKPIITSYYHCAERHFSYDERGNRTGIRYIGMDGKPMIRDDLGYAQIKWKYDIYNNKKKEIYLGMDGKPIIKDNLGYAQIQWEYDKQNRQTKEGYLDADGQSVVCKEGGYALYYTSYWDEGNKKANHYCGVEGVNDGLIVRDDNDCALISYIYDEFGQCIEVEYRDPYSQPVINSQDYCAGISYEYDERGNQTYIWYWGVNDQVEEREDIGIAMEYRVYDEYGHVTEEYYYIVNPEDESEMILGIHKELKYAYAKYQYKDNRLIEEQYFDAEDALIYSKEYE